MSIAVQRTITDEMNFVVKSPSGGVLLKSVDFKNRREMEETIKHLTSLTKLKTKVERKTNHDGKFLFSVKKNHKIIGHSGLFSSEAGMENGINNLSIILTSL